METYKPNIRDHWDQFQVSSLISNISFERITIVNIMGKRLKVPVKVLIRPKLHGATNDVSAEQWVVQLLVSEPTFSSRVVHDPCLCKTS